MRYIVNSLCVVRSARGALLHAPRRLSCAANRAQYAIKTYQTAPAVEEAVFVLAKRTTHLACSAARRHHPRHAHQLSQQPLLAGRRPAGCAVVAHLGPQLVENRLSRILVTGAAA